MNNSSCKEEEEMKVEWELEAVDNEERKLMQNRFACERINERTDRECNDIDYKEKANPSTCRLDVVLVVE